MSYTHRAARVYQVRHRPTGLFASGELEVDRLYVPDRGKVWLDHAAAAGFAHDLRNQAAMRQHQKPDLEVVAFDLVEVEEDP